MILIDNYDSFTYNIVQYLQELGINLTVFKNDEITIPQLKKINFNSIIISPGAGNPNTAGISLDVIKEFYKTKKILGVCLGYHSLIVDRETIHFPLKITAQTDDGIVMAIEHETLPLYGVQFHPEAILTQYGHELFRNFIEIQL